MNTEKKIILLYTKFCFVKTVLQKVQDQYCDQDPESLTETTYLSAGNSLKKLSEIEDNLEETFEALSIEFNSGETENENATDGIWKQMEKKYTSGPIKIQDVLNMLFKDFGSIGTNIHPFASSQFITRRVLFNPLTQETIPTNLTREEWERSINTII